jgi:hypothetical protein
MKFRALQVRQKPGGELITGKITGSFSKTMPPIHGGFGGLSENSSRLFSEPV